MIHRPQNYNSGAYRVQFSSGVEFTSSTIWTLSGGVRYVTPYISSPVHAFCTRRKKICQRDDRISTETSSLLSESVVRTYVVGLFLPLRSCIQIVLIRFVRRIRQSILFTRRYFSNLIQNRLTFCHVLSVSADARLQRRRSVVGRSGGHRERETRRRREKRISE